jgi:hypothetical protein
MTLQLTTRQNRPHCQIRHLTDRAVQPHQPGPAARRRVQPHLALQPERLASHRGVDTLQRVSHTPKVGTMLASKRLSVNL